MIIFLFVVTVTAVPLAFKAFLPSEKTNDGKINDTAQVKSPGVTVPGKVDTVYVKQPEKKRVVTTETPLKQEAAVKTQIPEELNGAVFDSLASSNSLRFYDIQKNTCSITGRLCGETITTIQLIFDGKTFRTRPGDWQGSFSILNNNTQIVGSLMERSSKMPCPFTLSRR
jgi:hypothetical protein